MALKIVYDPYCCRIGPCSRIILFLFCAAGLITGFVGMGSYIDIHSRILTECLPYNYQAKIGLCEVCTDIFSCSEITYPVKGYVTFMFIINEKNYTITYNSLFCGNSINGTLKTGEINYPSNKWIKCGYKNNSNFPIILYGDEYPWDQKSLMIVGFVMVGISFLIWIITCNFAIIDQTYSIV